MHLLASGQTVQKFPYSLEELRADNPGVSFPVSMSEEELSSWGVFPVVEETPPPHNQATENLIRTAPALTGGEWVWGWTVTPADADEVEERRATQARLMRARRTTLLAATDYTQLPDFTGSAADREAFVQLRQSLRDVPSQPGFPWAVEWPGPYGQSD